RRVRRERGEHVDPTFYLCLVVSQHLVRALAQQEPERAGQIQREAAGPHARPAVGIEHEGAAGTETMAEPLESHFGQPTISTRRIPHQVPSRWLAGEGTRGAAPRPAR